MSGQKESSHIYEDENFALIILIYLGDYSWPTSDEPLINLGLQPLQVILNLGSLSLLQSVITVGQEKRKEVALYAHTDQLTLYGFINAHCVLNTV